MQNIRCSQCLLDQSFPNIRFNEKKICNQCLEYEHLKNNYIFSDLEIKKNLENLKIRLKKRKSNKYDCLIGLSGGVDSSYLALISHRIGLNALCVHFDNGWNSSIAIQNINNIIEKTGYDYQTIVVDWEEFRDLQRSFFKAGVIDIEMLTDQANFGTMYNLTKKYKIKTIFSGTNFSTEHGGSKNWVWRKFDVMHIKDIHSKFGSLKKLSSFPFISTFKWHLMRIFKIGAVFEEPLNLINYKKIQAITELEKEFNWENPGDKHSESLFTDFYQKYVLPKKFNVDKRLIHLSALIRNGEISRDEALKIIEKPPYDEKDLKLKRQLTFVSKKLGFEVDEFIEILNKEPVNHSYYRSDMIYMKYLSKVYNFFLNKNEG